MFDTEREDAPDLMWEISKGTPVVIAFTGMADRLHEMSFEWVGSTKEANCSKIYCKDPDQMWFHTWPLENLIVKAEKKVIAIAAKLIYGRKPETLLELEQAIIELSDILGGPGVTQQ